MRVVTLFADRRDYAQELAQLGISETCLGLSGPRDLLRGIPRLSRLLRNTPTDLVHTHLFCANVIGRLAARRGRLPVVSTLHAADYEPAARLGNPGLGLWKHEFLRCVDRLSILTSGAYTVAVSKYVAASARRRLGVSAERLRIVPNGIDLDRFRPDPRAAARAREELGIPSTSVFLLCVGRLSLEKGQDLLLRALARDEVHDLPLETRLVGEGESRAPYEALATQLGVANRVRFLGARSDVPALMQAADFLVLPSRDEGFGLVLAEGLASALPVIASRLPAVAEIVCDGETGLLFPSGDVASLARALRELALDVDRRRTMGMVGRLKAEARFGVVRMMDSLTDLYDELAKT